MYAVYLLKENMDVGNLTFWQNITIIVIVSPIFYSAYALLEHSSGYI